MNWKKIVAFTLGSGLVGGFSPWLQATASGQHVPFTAGTILVPAVIALAGTLTALFTHRPQDK